MDCVGKTDLTNKIVVDVDLLGPLAAGVACSLLQSDGAVDRGPVHERRRYAASARLSPC